MLHLKRKNIFFGGDGLFEISGLAINYDVESYSWASDVIEGGQTYAECYTLYLDKWVEPRSVSCLSRVIVRVREVFRKISQCNFKS